MHAMGWAGRTVMAVLLPSLARATSFRLHALTHLDPVLVAQAWCPPTHGCAVAFLRPVGGNARTHAH